MPRFDILMKPTALPKSFAKDRGSEHRMVVDDYSKHEAVRQARNSASLSGLYLARLHKLKQAVNTETGEITAGDQDDDALRQVEQGGEVLATFGKEAA